MRAVTSILPLLVAAAVAQEPLRVVHFSDSHLPRPPSVALMRKVVEGFGDEPVQLVVHTGDITEFGGRRDAWPEYQSVFAETGVPLHSVLGNHDLTWDGLFDRIEQGQGRPYYAFEEGGVHFFALCSASYEDPRPSFGEDQLVWLETQLDDLRAGAPLVLMLHHPPQGNEFASGYELRRLHEILAGRNVLALLVGHGHGVRTGKFGSFDWIMGGSTFGNNAGHGLLEIGGGELRYRYRFADPAKPPRELLRRALERPAAPELKLAEPAEGEVVAGRRLAIEGSVRARAAVELRAWIDEEEEPRARQQGQGRFRLACRVGDLPSGVHVVSVEASDGDGHSAWSVRRFAIERDDGGVRLLWRRRFATGFVGAPALHGGRLLVCGKDGRAVLLDAENGRSLAEHELGSVVAGGAAPFGADGFVVGTGAGALHALASGPGELRELWSTSLGAPVTGTPLVAGERVFAVDLAGSVHAVEGGRVVWWREAASWAIEKGPVALPGDRLCFGAWDARIRCLAQTDGEEQWSLIARGARGAGARYYSPADCPPVCAAGRVFTADRKFELTVTDLDGQEVGGLSGVAAVAASPAGDAVYLRGTEGSLRRLDPRTLEVVWTRELPVGRTPTPPAVTDEHVLIRGERDGMLYLVDAGSGKVADAYRVDQGLYPFAPLAVDGRVVYAASLDGTVTALAF